MWTASLSTVLALLSAGALTTSIVDTNRVLAGFRVGPLLCAIAAASFTHRFFLMIFVFQKPNPTLTHTCVPVQSTSSVNKFLFQHLADLLEKSYYHVGLNAGQQAPGKAVEVTMIRSSQIYTSNPEDFQYFMRASHRYVKGRATKLMQRLFGEGLLTTVDEDLHKFHRKIVGPAFSPKSLSHIANRCVPDATAFEVKNLSERVRKASANDAECVAGNLQDWLDTLTFNIICQAAFKTSSKDGEATKEVRRIFNDGFAAAVTGPRMIPFVEAITWKNNQRAAEERGKALRVVKAVMDELKKDTSQLNSSGVADESADALIEYLVHSNALTEQQVSDHSLVFLFAGFETTATALGWALYCLAKYQDVQSKLFEEISSASSLGGKPTLDDIQNCSYLKAFCNEVLRLYPPVPQVGREVLEDDVLPGTKTFVPKGTQVYGVQAWIQRDPQYWGADAFEFNPDRWESEPGFEKRMISAGYWVPFSVGNRHCIGKDFAMNEMKLILAQVVRTFSFSWPEGEPEPQLWALITLRSKQPFNLKVKNRTE